MARTCEVTANVDGVTSSSPVFYLLSITHVPLSRRWQLQRRYKEFDLVRSSLLPLYPNVPQLPPKTLWNRTDSAFLTQRQTRLNAFLREITLRTDLIRSQIVRNFFEIDKFAPEVRIPEAIYRGKYTSEGSFMRVITSNTAIFTISASKWTLHLQLTDSPSSELSFKPIWTALSPSFPTELCYDPFLTLLAIGLDTGQIQLYRIYTELNCEKYDLFSELPVHISAVRGLAMNYQNSRLFSVADDCRLVVTDINKQEILADVMLSERPKSMHFLQEFNRLYLGFSHKMAVFNVESTEPTPTIERKCSGNLTVLTVIPPIARVFLGTSRGNIDVYRLGMIDCEETTHLDQILVWKGAITAMGSGKKDLFVGNDEGLVGIWSLERMELVGVIVADGSGVRAISGNDSSETLLIVSCGGDRALKVYEIPTNWEVVIAAPQSVPSAWSVTDDDLAGWDS